MRTQSRSEIISHHANERVITKYAKPSQQHRSVRVPLPLTPLLLGVQQNIAEIDTRIESKRDRPPMGRHLDWVALLGEDARRPRGRFRRAVPMSTGRLRRARLDRVQPGFWR